MSIDTTSPNDAASPAALTDLPLVEYNPDITIPTGKPWILQLDRSQFIDPEGDPLSFSATLADGSPLPDWLGFDSQRQVFYGIPKGDNNGLFILQVTATDPYGNSITKDYSLMVENPDNKSGIPQVNEDIPDFNLQAGKPFLYRIPANAFVDPDGDPLTYSVVLSDGSELPPWMGFDEANKVIYCIPPEEVDGQSFSLHIIASDKDGSALQLVDLSVGEVTNPDPNPDPNPDAHAPYALADLANQYFEPGQGKYISLHPMQYKDPDGEPLTLSVDFSDPAAYKWLQINPDGSLVGVAPINGFDPFVVKVTATDPEGLSVYQKFVIADPSSYDDDGSYELYDVPDQSVSVGKEEWIYLSTWVVPGKENWEVYSYEVTLADGSPLPDWMTVNDYNELVVDPGMDNVGSIDLKLTVTWGPENQLSSPDADYQTRSDLFTLNVTSWLPPSPEPQPGQHAPKLLTPLPDQGLDLGQPFRFSIAEGSFGDADGDKLQYMAFMEDGSPLPDWLYFDANNGTFYGVPPTALDNRYSVDITVLAHDESGLYAADTFTLFDNMLHPAVEIEPVFKDMPLTTSLPRGYGGGYIKIPEQFAVDGNRDPVTLTATLADGSPLPESVYFDPVERALRVSGDLPTEGVEVLFTATDSRGFSSTYLLPIYTVDHKYLDGTNGNDMLTYNPASPVIMYGYEGNDYLFGGYGNRCFLDGGSGDDVLVSMSDDAYLSGGTGNDMIRTGLGDSFISFSKGDGVDTLQNACYFASDGTYGEMNMDPGYQSTLADWERSLDYLSFNDVTSKELWFSKSDDDLVISILGSEDKVIIDGWYKDFGEHEYAPDGAEIPRSDYNWYRDPERVRDAYYRLDTISADDGSTLSKENVDLLVQAMANYEMPTSTSAAIPAEVEKARELAWSHPAFFDSSGAV